MDFTKKEFTVDGYTIDQLDLIVKLLKRQAGEDGPEKFIRGEISISRIPHIWRERDGIIYCSVTSDGTNGPKWFSRLERKGYSIDEDVEAMLSSNFKPTSGTVYEIAILKGIFLKGMNLIAENIHMEAQKRGWNKSTKSTNIEIACLMCDKFLDQEIKDMDLSGIVIMSEPVKDSNSDDILLSLERGSYLGVCYDDPDENFGRRYGFAYIVSQKSLF